MSNTRPASKLQRFFAPGPAAFLGVASLLLLAGTFFWLGVARRPLGVADQWIVKVNQESWPFSFWGLPVVMLGLGGGLATLALYDRFRRAKTPREQRFSTRLCLLSLSVLALVWPWTLLGPPGAFNLIAATWSDTSNGYFGAAYRIENSREFTRDFATRSQMSSSIAQAHVATHPPGAVLFYFGARRVYEASPLLQDLFTNLAEYLTDTPRADLAKSAAEVRGMAATSAGAPQISALPASAVGCAVWCAFLLSLAAALTVPAVYRLAAGGEASGAHREARGLLGAALFVLAPSVVLFAFTLDVLIMCGAAWALAAAQWRPDKWWSGLLLGVMVALLSFLSFGALAVAAIIVLALVAQGNAARRVFWLAAGFAGAWLLLCLIWPMQPLIIFANAMQTHHAVALAPRTYTLWAWLNIVFFALFCGWPLAAGVAQRIWHGSKIIVKQRSAALEELARAGNPAGWAALLVMVLLSLSGNVRGEVERLWLFLVPPLCALAAVAIDPLEDSTPAAPRSSNIGWIVVLLLVQALQTLLLAITMAPLVRP